MADIIFVAYVVILIVLIILSVYFDWGKHTFTKDVVIPTLDMLNGKDNKKD